MATVQLTNGPVALVDDADLQIVRSMKWYAHYDHGTGKPYVRSTTNRGAVLLHRFLTNAPAGVPVDHKNGDGLDNRRSNLRLTDGSGNQANRATLPRNTSGFRGVTFNRRVGKWQATVRARGANYYLGLFQTAEEGARAYDAKARELFGEFARPNFEEWAR